MEDFYDNIPFSLRTERICRMRDIIIQIEYDYELYEAIKTKIENGIINYSDLEEEQRVKTWLKKDFTLYGRLQSMSIEGITCGKLFSKYKKAVVPSTF